MTIRYRRGALVLYMWPPSSPRRRLATPWPGSWSHHVYVNGQLWWSADLPAGAGRPCDRARDRRD